MPEFRGNEALGLIRSGLRDFSVSRTSLTWGIPLPCNWARTRNGRSQRGERPATESVESLAALALVPRAAKHLLVLLLAHSLAAFLDQRTHSS